MMDEYELDRRIKAANNLMIGDEPEEVVEEDTVEAEEQPIPQPIDWYQREASKRRDVMSKPVQRGASTLTNEIAEEALNDLAKFKKRAEMDAEYWRMRGDKEREQMVKSQYIEEHFLPAVEMVIIASTPDEVLNSKDVLKEFDDLSMQYGPGYTASYIRTAYGDQLGNASNQSDGYIKDTVERIRYLVANDQIRIAYGIAKKAKDDIDNGRNTADDVDYEIISRVVSIN